MFLEEDSASELSDSSEDSTSNNDEEDKNEEENEQCISSDAVTENEEEDEKEDQNESIAEMTVKLLSLPAINNETSDEADSINPKKLICNCAFTNQEDHDFVEKLCNNDVIFNKFRTWMKEELKVNFAVKILEKKMLLLDPTLTIIPKQQARGYVTEPPHLPVRDIKVLRKGYKPSGTPDKIITTFSYKEITTLSPRREEERIKPKKDSKKRKNITDKRSQTKIITK